jgi:hypothetical protein
MCWWERLLIFSPPDAGAMDISHGFHLLRDGDAWTAVGPDFVDLVRSPAGFGATKEAAVKKLQAELRRAGYPDHASPSWATSRSTMKSDVAAARITQVASRG